MIGALKGTIFDKKKNPILLFVHDVGYSIYVTEALRINIKNNDELFLFIHSHIREDAFDLFGFIKEEELRLFEWLLTVSGIGPKTALSVMDRGVPSIEKAIQTSDVDFFTTIPRLGKKNAQKIIIELKTKLGSTEDLDLTGKDSVTKDLMDALLSMGFKRAEIIEAIKHVPHETLSLEQNIKESLKLLGK